MVDSWGLPPQDRLGAACSRSLCAWLLCAVVSGCGLFTRPPSEQSVGKIPAITPAPDSISLDIAFVERPVGDRLLGKELWDSVDQTAALEEQYKRSVREGGFRVGIVGSQPPPALEKMLGLSADFSAAPDEEQEKKLVGRQAVVRDGWKTEVQLGPAWPNCEVPIVTPDGKTSIRKLETARCVYQVTARRLEDGWVKLEFVPQVCHGIPRPVFTPGDGSWEFQYTQGIEDFPQQAFSLTLSLGEMAVVSAAESNEGTLGRLFFLGPEDNPKVQRLLVIRLANMALTADPYEEHEPSDFGSK